MEQSTIEQIIRLAFQNGENWANTYAGWFTPHHNQTEQKIQETIKQVMLLIPRKD